MFSVSESKLCSDATVAWNAKTLARSNTPYTRHLHAGIHVYTFFPSFLRPPPPTPVFLLLIGRNWFYSEYVICLPLLGNSLVHTVITMPHDGRKKNY
jgi:hypothetical protein